MKRAALFLALFLASGMAQAHSERHRHHGSCNIHSDYSIAPYRRAFVFNHESGAPGEIGIGGGRLFIDGREVKLNAADQQRVRRLEVEMSELVPQMRQVAVEAVDIAFTALTEVARGLSSDPDETVTSLESSHRRVRAELNARPLSVFNEDAIGEVVKPIITEYVPVIVGGAVSSALRAAFGGEEKAKEFEKRMQHMEDELDSRVERRADALEPLAEALCQRLRRIDVIDNQLEVRLPNGERLQLLRVDHDRN